MSERYCYILRSKEIDIAGVYTARIEAMSEGHVFARSQGVTESGLEIVNDELTTLDIGKSDTPCEIWVERHRLK